MSYMIKVNAGFVRETFCWIAMFVFVLMRCCEADNGVYDKGLIYGRCIVQQPVLDAVFANLGVRREVQNLLDRIIPLWYHKSNERNKIKILLRSE